MKHFFLPLALFILPVVLVGQSFETEPSVAQRLKNGANQWLADSFTSHAPEHFSGRSCRYRYALTNRPNTDELLTISCADWTRIKAVCELFFPLIDQELEGANLPLTYRYLPLALTGLDRSASYDPGRAGIWHLSYPIARKYGLEISHRMDERFAPDLATSAAVSYLAFLHERYKGNREKVALAFARSVPYVESLADGRISAEDRNLLEHVDALRIWHDGCPDNELLLDMIGMLNGLENVTFTQDISFENLGEALACESDWLHGANPMFIGAIIPALQDEFPFLLQKPSFDRMQAMGDSLYSFQTEPELALEEIGNIRLAPTGSSQTYVVKSGDALGLIAERFGVRTFEIKEWNNLRSDRINVGQKLLIYSAKAPPAPKTKPSPSKVTETRSQPANGTCSYTVKSGDSLWLIAQKFPGVSSQNLMEWNNMGDNLKPGQVIRTCSP